MRMRDIGDDGRELLFWSEHGDWNRSSCHNDKRGWKGMRKKKEKKGEKKKKKKIIRPINQSFSNPTPSNVLTSMV